MNAPTTESPSLKERILAAVRAAHAADRQYMDTHFSLGSAFTHCKRLESYLTQEGRAAAKMGLLGLEMPSEYHNPFYKVTGDLDSINAEQFEAALAEVKAEDESTAAWMAAEKAKWDWQRLNEVEAGKFVVVVGGRKVKKGTVGYVKRLIDNAYDSTNPKVVLATTSGGLEITYKYNCKVVLPTVD